MSDCDSGAPDFMWEFWRERFYGAYDTQFRNRVCTCSADLPPRTRIPGPYRRMLTCDHCGKPRKEYLNKCVVCKRVFLKDFSHPAFCVLAPRCWEHLGTEPCKHVPERLRTTEVIFPQITGAHLPKVEVELSPELVFDF